MVSALLLGATGQVGQNVLKELLASSHFTRVGEYGRRVTNLDAITSGKEKLEQKTVDFERIDQAGLKDGKWDVVFITFVALARDVIIINNARTGLERRESLREVLKHSRGLIGSRLFSLLPASYFLKAKAAFRYVLNAARSAFTGDPNHPQRVVYLSVKHFKLLKSSTI